MSPVDPAPHIQLSADFMKAMAGMAEAKRSAQGLAALAEVAPVEPDELAHVDRDTELDDEIEQILAAYIPDTLWRIQAAHGVMRALVRRTGVDPHDRPGASDT